MDKYAQNLAVAQADLGWASAAVSEADRQFVAARERLHFQQARLADTRICAPFDGLITPRDRDVGPMFQSKNGTPDWLSIRNVYRISSSSAPWRLPTSGHRTAKLEHDSAIKKG